MYKPISDYGIIGNLRTIALIARDGSIDWFCYPYIDSPSVFGALLDDEKGGRLSIRPTAAFDSTAEYVPGTNILTTRFRARTGVMKLTDFMPVSENVADRKEQQRHELYRIVELVSGTMDVRIDLQPRFDYGRADCTVRSVDHGVVAESSHNSLAVICSHPIQPNENSASALWSLQEGDRVVLRVGSTGETAVCSEEDFRAVHWDEARAALEATEDYWHTWLRKSETGRTFSLGRYRDMVERSALVLKLLFYGPSGAIAAAATTSLPECIGGGRNWDYRFTWVRDTSFTLQALFNLGHLSETEGYLQWVESVLSESGGAQNMQIMYGLRGERDLEEIELTHLDGYKGSRPVRIGNGAAQQKQLDIYGELMDAALMLADYVGKISRHQWDMLRDICDYVVQHRHEKDSGIWEIRGGPRHFVYSKVMCWVALDRGVTIAERYGFPGDLETWRTTMNSIKNEVLEKGYNDEIGAFVQYYDSDVLDSSNLLLPILGFVPFHEAKTVSTIEKTMTDLSHDGLLYRYRSQDGIQGGEGTFTICTFWLVECLTRMGRVTEAEHLLIKLEKTANHLGLFSEEYDVEWREALGNFPQAFTHIGFVNAAVNLMKAKEKEALGSEPESSSRPRSILEFINKRILARKTVLNEGEPREQLKPANVVPTLKEKMNLLRGAFFDVDRGRVAYERMSKSELYGDYVDAATCLKDFDPGSLESREAAIAFWVNLYNVIVIHGVVELNVRDSVKEVRKFFRRIVYNVGGLEYSPDDMEHGILRGNRRPPHALFRRFGSNDPRSAHSIEPMDPRIHFALVCASSSCPPIALYTAEHLDEELTRAGETFFNGGGIEIDKKEGVVGLSSILDWYGEDFAETEAERLRIIAPYMYDPTDRKYLRDHADRVVVHYQDYDWRLNRGRVKPHAGTL